MGMNANSNDYLDGRKALPEAAGGELIAFRATLAFATGDLDLNDLGVISRLPAGHVPVDVYVDGTDMDSSTAAMIFDVGILNAAGDGISTETADGGAKWGSTTAVNTAFNQRLTHYLNAINTVTASDEDRDIVVKVATAPTTAVAGTLGLTLVCRKP